MYDTFSTTKYQSLLDEITSSMNWFQKLGIQYSRTRFGEYKRSIDSLMENYKTQNTNKYENEFVKMVNAVYEAHDCIQIYKTLAGKHDDEIRNHIKIISSGSVSYMSEKTSASSNRARNIAFELIVASRILSAGIDLDFTSRSDICCLFNNKKIIIECKRPQSISKVRDNIKDAFKQLEKKYKSSSSSLFRGIIAIDISKLINPKFQLYVQPTHEEISDGLSLLISNFIYSNSAIWQSGRHKNTIGILVRLGVMGIIENKNNLLTYCQQYSFTPINNCGNSNIATAKSFTEALMP